MRVNGNAGWRSQTHQQLDIINWTPCSCSSDSWLLIGTIFAISQKQRILIFRRYFIMTYKFPIFQKNFKQPSLLCIPTIVSSLATFPLSREHSFCMVSARSWPLTSKTYLFLKKNTSLSKFSCKFHDFHEKYLKFHVFKFHAPEKWNTYNTSAGPAKCPSPNAADTAWNATKAGPTTLALPKCPPSRKCCPPPLPGFI